MNRLTCCKCDQPIPNGRARIRSRNFRQVALCVACCEGQTMELMTTVPTPRTPADYGRELAKSAPPLTEEQIEAGARILATVERLPDSSPGR